MKCRPSQCVMSPVAMCNVVRRPQMRSTATRYDHETTQCYIAYRVVVLCIAFVHCVCRLLCWRIAYCVGVLRIVLAYCVLQEALILVEQVLANNDKQTDTRASILLASICAN